MRLFILRVEIPAARLSPVKTFYFSSESHRAEVAEAAGAPGAVFNIVGAGHVEVDSAHSALLAISEESRWGSENIPADFAAVN